MVASALDPQRHLLALLKCVDDCGCESYDYVDWWTTSWGRWAKQAAYRTEPLGNFIFAAPLLFCELWLPFLRKPLGIPKRVYPITVAHHGLSCLQLYRKTGIDSFLQSARRDADWLVSLAIPDAKGLCWGFPFVWVTNVGSIPPNQPAATQTAYAYDLFEGLWAITGEEEYLRRLLSVAKAVDEEYLNQSRPDGLVSTYHGRGYGDIVLNAICYRIHILANALKYGCEQFRPVVMGLIHYALSRQRWDGSWLYGEAPKNQFIDHYHTCFVIKNLARANRVLGLPEVSSAIGRGLGFYWEHLFDECGLPKPYAKAVRFNLVRYESYDFAECLGLFSLFGPDQLFTLERLNNILSVFLETFQMPNGTLRPRLYRLSAISIYPYFRFGMTACMLSISQLVNSTFLTNEGADVSTPIA